MAEEQIVLVFHNDGGKALIAELDVEEHPGIEEALHSFIGVVREQLEATCRLREFRHVVIQETEDELQHPEAQSSLCLAIGTAQLDSDGQLQGATNLRSPFDLQALLTAKSKLRGTLGDKVALDEDGVLQIKDEQLNAKVDRLLPRLKTAERMQAALDEDAELVLVEGMVALAPEVEGDEEEEAVLEPMHPADLLTMLVAYMVENIAEAPSQPGPIQQAQALVGGLLSSALRRVRAARKVIWHVEDLAVGGAKLALHVARRSVRPLLVGLIVHRALRTIEGSRLPAMRMARMSPAERLEYHNTRLMGADWREQMEQDFLDAAKEVQDGYITDDYRDEKRKLSAAMLRRLEIEDWDKERMRHFYYGSYGLGPWYFDMEERLHNPYFIGARAWNGPIEGWVGKNKAYADDIPASNVDWSSAALDVLEKKRGVRLGAEQRRRIAGAQAVNAKDLLLSNSRLAGAVGRDKLKQALEGR